jgi:hypothetical protein
VQKTDDSLFIVLLLVDERKFFIFAPTKSCTGLDLKKILRGGAVVARWAHNPKVVGSNPAPATNQNARWT